MAKSDATTVEAYLAELPPDRAEAMRVVRSVVNEHLQPGYVEVVDWGMIAWEIPLETYPDTYNKKPMMMAALGNQKNYISLHLVGVYVVPELLDLLLSSGKKPRMGKGCINFTSADELPLPAIGEIIRRQTLDAFLRVVTEERAKRKAAR